MTYRLLFLVEFLAKLLWWEKLLAPPFCPTCFTILLHIYHQTLGEKKRQIVFLKSFWYHKEHRYQTIYLTEMKIQ